MAINLTMNPSLRISTPEQEGIYQSSKYLKFQVLCDAEELAALFDQLGTFFLFSLTGIGDGNPIPSDLFLQEYGRWIEGLKQGRIPEEKELRRLLACALTADLDALWMQAVSKGYLIKMAKPVIHIQSHFFTYSPLDGIFRPNVMGMKSIFWGLQFSFPQVYQDPKTMELKEVGESVNKELFQRIRKWVREKTRATPFFVNGTKINSPIRIGRNCLSWIHSHPQLSQQNIGVSRD